MTTRGRASAAFGKRPLLRLRVPAQLLGPHFQLQVGSGAGHSDVVRDSFIPLFDGKPSSYREYRQRLVLYYKKMKLNKKPVEATINLLTSLTGNAWKQVQHLSESATESEEGFQTVLEALDKAFKYDDRVEMPRALDKFLYGLMRRPDQTLLSYCSDHCEALQEIQMHGIKLFAEVEGWILLRRSATKSGSSSRPKCRTSSPPKRLSRPCTSSLARTTGPPQGRKQGPGFGRGPRLAHPPTGGVATACGRTLTPATPSTRSSTTRPSNRRRISKTGR